MGPAGLANRRILPVDIKSARAEELLWRLSDKGVEIVDHVSLVGKAAGICDVCPGGSRLPHRQNFLDTCDACKMLRAGPEHRPEATRQMPFADIQLRCKSPHTQRGIASQILRSPAHDGVRPVLVST